LREHDHQDGSKRTHRNERGGLQNGFGVSADWREQDLVATIPGAPGSSRHHHGYQATCGCIAEFATAPAQARFLLPLWQ
jgi:hypothetical protein